jgi:hypothetical protein
MADVRIKVRHLVAKRMGNGATVYYWQPSRLLRRNGFAPQRVARATNALADAIREAEALNVSVDRWRAGDHKKPIAPETMPWLIRQYQQSADWLDLRPSTQRGYRQCFNAIEAWSQRAGDRPLSALTKRACVEFYDGMAKTPAWAGSVARVLRLLLSFADRKGFLERNPAADMKIRSLRPRDEVWTDDQITALCAKADELGRASIGLAVRIAAGTAQREGDVIALTWRAYDGSSLRVRQSKTRWHGVVPLLAELKVAIDATPKTATTIVVAESTGRPYRADHFRHEFARVRDAAGIPQKLQFRDLRRTAAVALATAGCTLPEIAAIGGWSIDRTARILETYVPRNETMARAAVAKLEEHRRRNADSTKVGS